MNKFWKTMPSELKVIFLVNVFGLILSILTFLQIPNSGLSFFGFLFYGIPAVIINSILTIILIVFVSAWIFKYSWTWYLGLGYYFLSLANALLSFLTLNPLIEHASANIAVPANIKNAMFIMMAVMLTVGIIFNVVFIWMFYKHKAYFRN
jgi:hypothetical protein